MSFAVSIKRRIIIMSYKHIGLPIGSPKDAGLPHYFTVFTTKCADVSFWHLNWCMSIVIGHYCSDVKIDAKKNSIRCPNFSKMNLHNRYASRFHRRCCILWTKSIGIILLCILIVFIYSRVPKLWMRCDTRANL